MTRICADFLFKEKRICANPRYPRHLRSPTLTFWQKNTPQNFGTTFDQYQLLHQNSKA